jgi:sugar lactone lactonase YvrE
MKRLLLISLLLAGRLLAQPVITTQPTNQIVLNGSNVTFGVAVSGTGLFAYQWQFNSTNLPNNNIITTVAGGGNGGDGGFATNANIAYPYCVAVDTVGNLYFGDSVDVRKVDTNGIITTVAGNGTRGFTGDGGFATNASLSFPNFVVADAYGNLFITDAGNSRIRRVDTNGIITTVVGNGSTAYSGDGGPATNASLHPVGLVLDAAGNLFISDYDNARIRKVDTNGIISTIVGNGTNGYSGDGGAATNASLNGPYGLAFDPAGNLYICEQVNGCVRKVDTTGIISTVASGGFNEPDGVAVDAAGNIYVADSINNFIKKVDTNGVITYVTRSNYPIGVAVDTAGNLYFGDAFGGTVREVHYGGFPTLSLTTVSTNNAGNYNVIITSSSGSVTSAVAVLTVVFPLSLIVQPTSQLVPAGSNVTFSVVASGSSPVSYQWFYNGTAMDAQTNASLSLSNITTNQAGAYIVWITSPYGSITSHIATLTVGWLPNITLQPTNQALLAGGRALIVAGVSGVGPLTFQWQLNGTNLPNNLITTVAGNGTSGFAGDGGIATTGKIYFPYGVAADNAGNIYIADSNNSRVRKVDTNGIITTVAGRGTPAFSGDGGTATNALLAYPNSVVVDASGNLFIADSINNRIRKVDTNGIITTVAGKSGSGFSGDGGAATNAALYNPSEVTVDNSGNLYITDSGNNRIRKVDFNGIITTVAGKSSSGFAGDGGAATNASLYNPGGLAVDSNGNLFIADVNNKRVRMVDVYGMITTIAGNGTAAYSGDNGLATNAGMSPYAVSVDGYGDVLIADRGNNRIRQVDPYGIITTVAGTNSHGYAGDGVVATSAPLYDPSGVAMDSYGRVLIADTYNNRIRRFGQGPTLVLDRLTAANAGNYTLVVNSSYGSVTSMVATLTVLLPPTILSPPASQTIGLGSNATFAVTLMGTEPLAYQWRFNGTNLANQTGQFLNLTNVQWSDAGNYQVVITNNYGSITSAVATMTVGLPPAIASQPTNQIVLVGSNGQLSVVVTGDGPFTYQWRLNGTNLPPIITTVAGTNGWGYSGDGGSATNARLNNPYGVAVDGAGNVLIADNANYRVRKVDTNGIITTIAGTGVSGYTGNGGPATNSTLGAVQAVTLDAVGSLYIADWGDVRKVDTNGVITRVAGTGAGGFSWDGGLATNSVLFGASAVAVDGQGNLFIADYYSYRIRKVGTNGIITTVAGITAGGVVGGFSGDGGKATNANLSKPYGLAVDVVGNIFISDTDNARVRKVDTNGIINSVVGGGSSSSDGLLGTNTLLSYPYGVGLDRYNNLYITTGSRVRKMDTNGIMTTVAGGGNNNPGDYGPATSAKLSSPRGVGFDTQGNLYIADTGYNRIRKVHFSGDPTLQLLNASITNSGNYSVLITSPFGSVVSSVASLTVVASPIIQTFSFANGQFNLTWSTASNLTYQLQYTLDLSTTNWIDLGSPITATNGSVTASDVPGTDSQRFYRIKMN